MDSIFSSRQGKVFFFILALVLIGLAVGIARPYLNSVFLAVIVAYIVQPLYKALLGRINPQKKRASIISTIIVIIFTLLIVTLILFTVIRIISLVIDELRGLEIVNNPETDLLDEIVKWLNNLFTSLKIPLTITSDQILKEVQNTVSSVLSFLASSLTSIGSASASAFINIIVFYGLIILITPRFDDMLRMLARISPFDSSITNLYVKRALETAKSMAWGLLIIALAQGGLAALIFTILGLKSALLFAVLVGIFSFLPLLGVGMITIPIAAVFVFNGEYVKAIVLVLFQVLVIGLTDPILRSRLIPRQVRMPMVVSLVAILGGLAWFGVWGLIYGPVIFSLLLATFELVRRHFFIKSREELWQASLKKKCRPCDERHHADGWNVRGYHPAHQERKAKPLHVKASSTPNRYRRILKRYLLKNQRDREKKARQPWSCRARRKV